MQNGSDVSFKTMFLLRNSHWDPPSLETSESLKRNSKLCQCLYVQNQHQVQLKMELMASNNDMKSCRPQWRSKLEREQWYHWAPKWITLLILPLGNKPAPVVKKVTSPNRVSDGLKEVKVVIRVVSARSRPTPNPVNIKVYQYTWEKFTGRQLDYPLWAKGSEKS